MPEQQNPNPEEVAEKGKLVPREPNEAAHDQGHLREPLSQEDWQKLEKAQKGINTSSNPDKIEVRKNKPRSEYIEELGLPEDASLQDIAVAIYKKNSEDNKEE